MLAVPIQKGGAMPKDRPKIFQEIFVPLWEEMLCEFSEYSFLKKDLGLKVDVSMQKLELRMGKKLYRELYKTFIDQREEIIISTAKHKDPFFFTEKKNLISIKEKPSLATSMMQMLILLTRERLKRQKRDRVRRTKKRINKIVIKNLLEAGYIEGELEKRLKAKVFYRSGIYYLKARLAKKKLTNYLYIDKIKEELNNLRISLKIEFDVE